MLRPCACACRRTLTSINHPVLPTPPSLNLQTNTLLGEVAALATRGQLNEALSLFYTLQPPPSHCNQTYATLFHACARHHSLQQGLSLHHYMLAHNPITPHPDLFVSNHLINMYAKFGYLDDAHQLFDEMPRRNLVTWTALISEYAQRGRSEACFRLFAAMLVHYLPNEFAFTSVLSSCADSDGGYGRQVHALALKMSLDVANAVITMYSKVCDHGVACEKGKDGLLSSKTLYQSHLAVDYPSTNSFVRLATRGRGRVSVVNSIQTMTSTSSPRRRRKYDVFLSFRGADTRKTFTCHLYRALTAKGIITFLDDESLERGSTIGPSLFTAIQDSRMAYVVLSENFASSSWCLDELSKLLQCSIDTRQPVVMPIFYRVDPSDVCKQRGSFQLRPIEVREHEEVYGNKDKLKVWRHALTKVGNTVGYDSRKYEFYDSYVAPP